MGPGAEFPTGEGAHARRAITRRQTGGPPRRPTPALRIAARPIEVEADEAARALVARVTAFVEEQARLGAVSQPRGLGRQMALAALLLDREAGGGIDETLERVVDVHREARTTTPAALRKHASEARGLLHYGQAEGATLPELAASLTGDSRAVLREIDAVLAGLNSREILETRAKRLSGQRGGRPSGEAFRVLTMVARLKEVARGGDAKAEAELKLVRTFLLDE